MKVLALLALCVAGVSAMTAYDDNPLLNEVLTGVETMDANDCGCEYGCRPTIIKYPYEEKNKSSVIQPVPGNRANVALIVHWGTCSPTHVGYTWGIDWGDGVYSHGYYRDLLQVDQIHTYDTCGPKRITARYCSAWKDTTTPNTRGRCSYYSRVIDVTFKTEF